MNLALWLPAAKLQPPNVGYLMQAACLPTIFDRHRRPNFTNRVNGGQPNNDASLTKVINSSAQHQRATPPATWVWGRRRSCLTSPTGCLWGTWNCAWLMFATRFFNRDVQYVGNSSFGKSHWFYSSFQRTVSAILQGFRVVPETQGPGKVLKGFIKTTQSHIAVRFILWIFINNKGVNYHMNITACDLVQSDLVQSAAWDNWFILVFYVNLHQHYKNVSHCPLHARAHVLEQQARCNVTADKHVPSALGIGQSANTSRWMGGVTQ